MTWDEIPEFARYHNPPGWPRPSARWVREHQGIDPAPGWIPVAGVPAAPADWVFWSFDGPATDALVTPGLGAFTRRIWISASIFVAGVVLTILLWFVIIFWGAIVFGAIDIVRMIRGRARYRDEAIAMISSSVADARQQILAEEFARMSRS